MCVHIIPCSDRHMSFYSVLHGKFRHVFVLGNVLIVASNLVGLESCAYHSSIARVIAFSAWEIFLLCTDLANVMEHVFQARGMY